jgi:hypothetical protein
MPRNPRFPGDEVVSGKRHKAVPFEFVLDAVAPLRPMTRPMFGCLAVYVEDRIVLILRDRESYPADNGVWLATSPEHRASLQREFPRMRSIGLFGTKETSWQILPADAPDFEESARRACALVLARDPRIGKVPGSRTVAKRGDKPPRTPGAGRRSRKGRRAAP